ncbi:MAG: hypothetical protein ABW119_22730 [Candidatus Thiodiazotropha lotti]
MSLIDINKRIFASLLTVLLSVSLLSGCSNKPAELLLGQWVVPIPPKSRSGIHRGFEFFKDGTLSVLTATGAIGGSYGFIDEDTIKMELGGILSLAGTQVFDLTFEDHNTLVMRPPSSNNVAFKMVRKKQ